MVLKPLVMECRYWRPGWQVAMGKGEPDNDVDQVKTINPNRIGAPGVELGERLSAYFG
jgi:hypothetical protein